MFMETNNKIGKNEFSRTAIALAFLLSSVFVVDLVSAVCCEIPSTSQCICWGSGYCCDVASGDICTTGEMPITSCDGSCAWQPEECPGSPPVFDYTITVQPISGVANRNDYVDTLVAVTRTGGTAAPVDLSCANLPFGVSCSFSKTSCTPPCTSSLRISTNILAGFGDSSITIRGISGALTREAYFNPFTITDCRVTSASVSDNQCTGIGGVCEEGDIVEMVIHTTGSDCAGMTFVQMDYDDGNCRIEYDTTINGVDMSGIWDNSPDVNPGVIVGEWSVPAISPDCTGIPITPNILGLYKGPNPIDGVQWTTFEGITGEFVLGSTDCVCGAFHEVIGSDGCALCNFMGDNYRAWIRECEPEECADQMECRVDDSCAGPEIPVEEITLPKIYKGWNLISSPFDPILDIVEDTCDATDANFYYYNGETGKWVITTDSLWKLKAGVGYWFHSPRDCTITLAGALDDSTDVEDEDVIVSSGWNQIGVPRDGMTNTVSKMTEIGRCDDCVDSVCEEAEVLWYNPQRQEWELIDNAYNLVVGYGYNVECKAVSIYDSTETTPTTTPEQVEYEHIMAFAPSPNCEGSWVTKSSVENAVVDAYGKGFDSVVVWLNDNLGNHYHGSEVFSTYVPTCYKASGRDPVAEVVNKAHAKGMDVYLAYVPHIAGDEFKTTNSYYYLRTTNEDYVNSVKDCVNSYHVGKTSYTQDIIIGMLEEALPDFPDKIDGVISDEYYYPYAPCGDAVDTSQYTSSDITNALYDVKSAMEKPSGHIVGYGVVGSGNYITPTSNQLYGATDFQAFELDGAVDCGVAAISSNIYVARGDWLFLRYPEECTNTQIQEIMAHARSQDINKFAVYDYERVKGDSMLMSIITSEDVM